MGKIDYFEIGLKPYYAFETLVVGPHNQFAVSACHEVVKKPGEVYNPLFVYGPPGVGKTHLIQAVGQTMLEANNNLKVKYESAERLMSDILSAIAEDNVFQVREHFSKLDLLIIDDIQYLMESQATQEELLHIFNSMQQQNHQVIVAGDRPPNKLTGLNQTLRSRFEGGLSTDVKIPDQQTRVEILKKKQVTQNLSIPEDQLVFVAQNLASNVRELEGFLKRMHAYVHLSHQQITPQLVQLTVSEILPQKNIPAPPPAQQWNYPQPPPQPPPYPYPQQGMAPQAPYYPPPQGYEANPNAGRAVPPAPGAPTQGSHPNQFPPSQAPPPNQPGPGGIREPLMDPPLGGKGMQWGQGPPPPPAFVDPMTGIGNAPGSEGAGPPTSHIEKQDMFQYMEEAPTAALRKGPEDSKPPEAETSSQIPDFAKSGESSGGEPAASPPASPKESGAEKSVPSETAAPGAGVPEELPAGVKEVLAVFFFPEGSEETLELVYNKFQEVIKKHKLKFRLKRVHSQSYPTQGKVNYTSFVDVCKNAKVPVAIVIGPPPNVHFPQQDFYDLLSVTLDVQGISLQLINWSEVSKDYRYLNLSLDIALVKGK